MLQLSEDRRTLKKDGEPFFFLADTVWSAFTNIKLTDWEFYLEKRQAQGFNVIQMNMMPQWDRSVKENIVFPFETKEGFFDIQAKNESYFEHAEKMLEMAVRKGFTPALVLLWCNYIPETWAGNFGRSSFFKKEDIKEYTREMVNRFKRFNPIYLISGDTDFPTDRVTNYYLDCLEAADEADPYALKVLHIKRGLKDIPEKLKNHTGLDLYFYQSGHNAQFQDAAYRLAYDFYHMKPVRPVINSEPCYELMGYSRNEYGRFSREDVRRAAWQSVFSGAVAGITYGAHGIWSWHDTESSFGSGLGEGFAPPYNWRIAIEFEGADDYSYLKQFVEKEQLTNLIPNQSILINKTDEIRMAETDDRFYIYAPVNVPIVLDGKFYSADDYAIDLDKRTRIPLLKKELDGKTVIQMTSIIKDSVYVIHKNSRKGAN